MVSLALAALMMIGALILARHQVSQFRRGQDVANDERDLFRFTKKRLAIRLLGAVALLMAGGTLGVWELLEPLEPNAAQVLVALLIASVALLVVVAILDLRETAKRVRRR